MRRWTALFLALSIVVLTSRERLASDTWSVGNGRIQAEFRLAADGLVISSIVNPETGALLTAGESTNSSATINGAAAALGASAAGWILTGADSSSTDTENRITFTFRSTRVPVVAERTYVCYGQSPVIEAWTTYRVTGSTAVTIANPNVWELTIPASVFHYQHGLRGDAADAPVEDAFSLQTQAVNLASPLTLTERNRSTEQYLPMIAADLRADEFFGGLAWSGSWQIRAQSDGQGRTRVSAGLPGVSIAVDAGRPLETPHGFFGFTPGDRSDVATALHGFVAQGIRGGRPFQPLVTSNTWFAYGTDINEAIVKHEMRSATANGVELFVVDAGWYTGAGRGSDFDAGLGTWRVDGAKFPRGLRELRDYAHDLGLRFGIWVEPERVDQSTVGRAGLAQQAWFATNNGSLGSSRNAQICFASGAARQWVLERLTELIDAASPDYLKWDNNLWVNCTRSGHGHGLTDGNFAHVKGLYEVLATLRERYPDLIVENCAQGGNRTDFGMLRYTDVGWMDDRTTPAVHVRHNLQGLTTFFPPAYLLSFALSGPREPLAEAPDLNLYLRSRMVGILGLTYRAAELSESDHAGLAQEIWIYKAIREVQRDASAILLSPQAAANGPAWDVIQEVSASSGAAVIFAFQQDRGTPSVAVRPRGLIPGAQYTVTTADGEVLGSASAEDLMAGFTIEESPASAARVFILRPDRLPATSAVRGRRR